jgi:hypothetical protein
MITLRLGLVLFFFLRELSAEEMVRGGESVDRREEKAIEKTDNRQVGGECLFELCHCHCIDRRSQQFLVSVQFSCG